jgi:DNA-binding LacI/PurR family transcriptional regulator
MKTVTKQYTGRSVREKREKARSLTKRVWKIFAVIGAALSALLALKEFGLSWTIVLFAGAGFLLISSLAMNVSFIIDSFIVNRSAKYIAFLTPSSGDQPFYTSMLCGLVRNAALALHQNYIIIPSMPTRSFETVSIWSLFGTLEDRQLEIDGIFFIPDRPDEYFDQLVGFHENHGDVPLMLLDVYFDVDKCDERTRRRLPSFVGGDEREGGALASEIMVTFLQYRKDEVRNVIIVNGADTGWERQRAASFRTTFSSAYPGVNFIESRFINYNRREAFEEVFGLLCTLAQDGLVDCSGIFACNDDMALGSRAAIVRMKVKGFRFVNDPAIVGYDGISEIRDYIEHHDEYIVGSVDVKIDEQAALAIEVMHALIRGARNESVVELVNPVPLVPNEARWIEGVREA